MEDLFHEIRAWLGATEEEFGWLSPVRAVTESYSCRKPRWAEIEEWRPRVVSKSEHCMKQLLLLMPATFPPFLSLPTRFTHLKALTILV